MNSAAIQDMLSGVTTQVGQFLPNIAAAIGVLFIGWIVAHLIARVVRLAINKTGVDKHLANFLPTGKGGDVSRLIGKAVFYLIMLFVLVTFFNVLDLPIVSTPLNGFLNQVFEFAPRVISAGVLGAIGWLIATVVRQLSGKGLQAIDIDNKLASLGQGAQSVASATTSAMDNALETDGNEFSSSFHETAHVEDGEGIQLSKTIPEAAYWLILFLFLPAILGALQMPGLLEPIQGMFNKAMGYLPNIFGAGIILAIGLFVGKIIKQVVSNLAASFGADKLAQRVGLGGSTKLSNIAGVVCYALVLLPILVAALNTLNIDAVTQPASAVLEKITGLIPGVLGASVVLGIAYFVGKLVSGLCEELLGGVGFDDVPQKLGFNLSNNAKSDSTPSKLVSKLVLAAIMLLSVMQALPMMGMEMLAGHVETFIGFGTKAIMGVVILAVGLYLANLAAGFIRESGVANAKLLASVAQVAIIIFTGAIGLQQMGVGSSIVNLAFGTLIGGLGLAAAIAFGWGGRDAAKKIVDRYVS